MKWSMFLCATLQSCSQGGGILYKHFYPVNGHIKTAEQRTIIQQNSDWYTSRDEWAVTFGTARRGLGEHQHYQISLLSMRLRNTSNEYQKNPYIHAKCAFAVRRHWHVLHLGWSSPDSKQEWVRWVYAQSTDYWNRALELGARPGELALNISQVIAYNSEFLSDNF